MITRSFNVTEDGSEYEYVSVLSGFLKPCGGDYVKAEDAEVLEQLLLAYRDGHSVGSQECFAPVGNGLDYRCPLCREVDRVLGKGSSRHQLDEMLARLRSANNGL